MNLQAGKLLVATPRLADPIFGESIVFLTEYGEEGAQGFILNGRTIGFVALRELSSLDLPSDLDHTDDEGNPSPYAQSQMEDFMNEVIDNADKGPIYCGGPCQTPLYVVHGHADLHVTDPRRELVPGVYFAMPPDMISIVENTNDDRKLKFFMGVAGWHSGQLEREIANGAWIVQDSQGLSDVFWTPDRSRELVGYSPTRSRIHPSSLN